MPSDELADHHSQLCYSRSHTRADAAVFTGSRICGAKLAMSSISSLSSSVSPYQYGSSSTVNSFQKDLKSLESALSSGDLSSAQSALTVVQNDFQNLPKPPSGSSTSSSSSSSTSSAISAVQTDLKNIQSALQSSDTNGAKTAFDKLKTDLQSLRPQHAHRGHHGGGKPPVDTDGDSSSSTNSTSSTSSATDLLLNAIQSSSSSTSIGGTINQLG